MCVRQSVIAQRTPTFCLGLHKYSERIYEACVRSFDALPLAALIDGKFFAVHGGISPHLDKISDLGQVCTGMSAAFCAPRIPTPRYTR